MRNVVSLPALGPGRCAPRLILGRRRQRFDDAAEALILLDLERCLLVNVSFFAGGPPVLPDVGAEFFGSVRSAATATAP